MYNVKDIERHTQEDYAETLSRDERREAHRLMVEQFYEILVKSKEARNIYWTGTKTDLVELTHEMFTSGTMKDDMGRPCAFKEVMDTACHILHVKAPQNPYSMVSRARSRKGIRQQSFFSRYCWMLHRNHRKNPLHAMLRAIKN